MKPPNWSTTCNWSTSCDWPRPAPGRILPMSSYVSAALRRVVVARSDALCEYCLIHEDDTVFGCEVDHIVSGKARRDNGGGQSGVCLCVLQSGKGQRYWFSGAENRGLRAVFPSAVRPLGGTLQA